MAVKMTMGRYLVNTSQLLSRAVSKKAACDSSRRVIENFKKKVPGGTMICSAAMVISSVARFPLSTPSSEPETFL